MYITKNKAVKKKKVGINQLAWSKIKHKNGKKDQSKGGNKENSFFLCPPKHETFTFLFCATCKVIRDQESANLF
jgi:hypothetical protein